MASSPSPFAQTPGIPLLLFQFALFGLAIAPLHAGERTGSWDAESIVEYFLRYQDETKARFAERAERIEKQTGVVVPLDYQFVIEPNSREERNHQRFLDGELSTNQTNSYADDIALDIARVGQKLLEEEAKAFEAWKTDPKAFASDPPLVVGIDPVTADLYGEEVVATNLAVLLDRSPSMSPYLKPLREEITENFPNAHFAEIDGSFLRLSGRENQWYFIKPTSEDNPFDPAFWVDPLPKENSHYWIRSAEMDTLAAMRAMIVVRKVDAIYWFCDFDDEEDDRAIRELYKLLMDHKVRLYIHTLKYRPPKILNEVVERSGGSVIRHKIR